MKRCALLIVLALAPLAPAQDLRRIRTAIHPPPKFFLAEPPPRNPTKWFDADLSGAGGSTGGAGLGVAAVGLGLLGVGIATIPFWGPHELYDDGFDKRGWFTAHPFAKDDRASMVIGDVTRLDTNGDDYFDDNFVKPWSLRMSVDAGYDFDALKRYGGQLFLDTNIYRLGLLANANYYQEDLGFGRRDEALMTDYNLTWRVTQSDHVHMHLGLGVRMWTFEGETDRGLNMLYRADVFPWKHVHLTALTEASTIGDAWFLHGQIQAGFAFRHGEVFVGYDCLRVKKVTLQGPSVGVRLWF